GAPLFFVGDPKQAIYSFRNADLHTYLGARRHATAQTTLAYNQRSSPVLIDALNALFTTNRDAFILPGLAYHPVGAGTRSRSVFHTSDAEELERLLMAVLEPSRERLLRAALTTEVLGRDASEIDALSQDEGAIAALIVRFAGYRELWLRQGVAPTLRRFMADE